jgi:hypothetical protein
LPRKGKSFGSINLPLPGKAKAFGSIDPPLPAKQRRLDQSIRLCPQSKVMRSIGFLCRQSKVIDSIDPLCPQRQRSRAQQQRLTLLAERLSTPASRSSTRPSTAWRPERPAATWVGYPEPMRFGSEHALKLCHRFDRRNSHAQTRPADPA